MIILSCSSKEKIVKNISCEGNISVQYDRLKPKNSGIVSKQNLQAFTVYFLYEFNDVIKGFVNNELKYEKKLNLSGSSDALEEYFGYNYSKDSETPILKVISETKKTCFDIRIDKRYKVIYVYFSKDGKWTIRFSNAYYTS